MFYLIRRAFGRLWWNKKIYIFILLELVIGLTIIACQMNVSAAIEARLAEYERQFEKSGISIHYFLAEGDVMSDGLAITREDFEFLAKQYGAEVELSYVSYGSAYNFDMKTITILGMSDFAFERMFGVERKEPYIGSTAKTYVEKGVVGMDDELSIDVNGIQIKETSYPFQEFNSEQNKVGIIDFSSIAMYDKLAETCIVVPLSMQEILEEKKVLRNCTLELCGTGDTRGQRIREIGEEIIVLLSERHTNYTYEQVNKIKDYEENSASLSDSLTLLSWISGFSLFIVSVGITGVLFILLDKRRKDTLISYWVGAEKWKLVVELFLELCILCLLGGAVSLGIAAAMVTALQTSQYVVKMTFEAVWEVMGISLLIAIGTGSVSMLCVNTNRTRV